MNSFSFSSIGTISSCYKEKFGIPRQPSLVKNSTAELHLDDRFTEESIRGLTEFSHIWISFIFHQNPQDTWHSMVRPPRLGGNTKVGVFASRSPFRPNSLGLSVVELLNIKNEKSGIVLYLGSCDFLDQTPVLDIKPYLPYVDSIPDAKGGFANIAPEIKMKIHFSEPAIKQCKEAEKRLKKTIKNHIEEILQLDPRPSYMHNRVSDRVFAMKLYDFDLHWEYCENNIINVLGLLQKNEFN